MKTPTNFIPIIGPLYADDLQIIYKPSCDRILYRKF